MGKRWGVTEGKGHRFLGPHCPPKASWTKGEGRQG